MNYYIDGTIDSIELAMDDILHLHFTLQPSIEFLKTVAEGKKKALFIGECKPVSTQGGGLIKQVDGQNKWADQQPIPALLVNISKNESGKEMLRFEMPKTCAFFRGLLLEAKNNRNTVRISAQSIENYGKPYINFDEPVSITIL